MPTPINIPSATAVRTATVNGGNLFRIALDNLGNALQWNRIAASNRLIDPFLAPNTKISLIIPSINFDASESGVLQPNIGTPIFAFGGSISIPSAPIETAPPQITPTMPQVGYVLTATNGIWTSSPISFAYQWKRSGIIISGANSISYIPISADIGNTLTIAVVAINSFGASAPAISLPTSPVIDIIPTINTSALIPGTPVVGSSITAIDAIWNNGVTGRAYQWQVGGINGTGSGAATLSYTPVVGDLGQTLTITVVATNTGGMSLPSTSASSNAVAAATGDTLKLDLNIHVDSIPIGA